MIHKAKLKQNYLRMNDLSVFFQARRKKNPNTLQMTKRKKKVIKICKTKTNLF